MGGIYRRVINSGNLQLIYDSGNLNDDEEDFCCNEDTKNEDGKDGDAIMVMMAMVVKMAKMKTMMLVIMSMVMMNKMTKHIA